MFGVAEEASYEGIIKSEESMIDAVVLISLADAPLQPQWRCYFL